MIGTVYDNETETAPEQPEPKPKSRRGPIIKMVYVTVVLIIALAYFGGTIVGRLTAEPIYKTTPEYEWVMNALDVAWMACVGGPVIPRATKMDGDQGACWRVEEFDIASTPLGPVQAWRYMNRSNEAQWAWTLEGEGLCAEMK